MAKDVENLLYAYLSSVFSHWQNASLYFAQLPARLLSFNIAKFRKFVMYIKYFVGYMVCKYFLSNHTLSFHPLHKVFFRVKKMFLIFTLIFFYRSCFWYKIYESFAWI